MAMDFMVGMEHEEFSLVRHESPFESPVGTKVFSPYPSLPFMWMPKLRPLPELVMRLIVHPLKGLAGHRRNVISTPPFDDRVEFRYDAFLRCSPQLSQCLSNVEQVVSHGLLAWLNQGLKSNLVALCRILSCFKPQEIESGFTLDSFQGVTYPSLRWLKF